MNETYSIHDRVLELWNTQPSGESVCVADSVDLIQPYEPGNSMAIQPSHHDVKDLRLVVLEVNFVLLVLQEAHYQTLLEERGLGDEDLPVKSILLRFWTDKYGGDVGRGSAGK